MNGFVVAIIAIFVIGAVGVTLARRARVDAQVLQPIANEDQWNAAFGMYVCNKYLPDLPATATGASDTGITSSGTGLIKIAPTSTAASGRNAQFHLFSDIASLNLTSDSFTVGAKTYKAGSTCGSKKEKTVLRLFVWPPQANARVTPQLVSASEIGSFRFTQDQQILALALVPASKKTIPLPSSVSALTTANSSTTTPPASSDTTPTTAAATPTTTAAAPTTTAAKSSTPTTAANAGATTTSKG